MTQARDRRSDRGTATIWVLAVCVLLLIVAGVAAARAAAVLARHRAESAADVAALAAAGRLGTGQAPCLAAEAVARRNSATVDSCRVRADAAGRTGVVDVVVSVRVRLPGVGATRVRASARAGRQVAGRAPKAFGGWLRPIRLDRFGRERRVACWPRRPDAGVPSSNTGDDREQEGERVEVSVSRDAAEDVPVVSVSGEVDVYSAPELKESLAKLRQSGATSIVVDLTEVAFLDSTGLGALVEARAATTEAGGSLAIVCNQERILKLFTITGLDGVFSIHKSLDEALAALQP